MFLESGSINAKIKGIFGRQQMGAFTQCILNEDNVSPCSIKIHCECLISELIFWLLACDLVPHHF